MDITQKYQLEPNPDYKYCQENKVRLSRLIKNLQIIKCKLNGSRSRLDIIKLKSINKELDQWHVYRDRVKDICLGNFNSRKPKSVQSF